MLTVEDVFRTLSYGPLANQAIGASGKGFIREQDRPKVIGYTNEALSRLYTRFPLKERDLVLELHSHISNYKLDSRHARSRMENFPDEVMFILDLPEKPFADDALRIICVYDIWGKRMAMNDDSNPDSLYTPYPTTLQVSNPYQKGYLSVQYQASHPKLVYNDLTQEIDIPNNLEGALINFISYLAFSSMASQDATMKAQEYLGMYEAICTEVELNSFGSSVTTPSEHVFDKRGFV